MERKDVRWRKADWLNLVPNRDKRRGIGKTKENRGLLDQLRYYHSIEALYLEIMQMLLYLFFQLDAKHVRTGTLALVSKYDLAKPQNVAHYTKDSKA